MANETPGDAGDLYVYYKWPSNGTTSFWCQWGQQRWNQKWREILDEKKEDKNDFLSNGSLFSQTMTINSFYCNFSFLISILKKNFLHKIS